MIVRVVLSFVALPFFISIPSLHGEEWNKDYDHRLPRQNRRLLSGSNDGPPGLNRGGPPGWNRGGPPGSNRNDPPRSNQNGPPGFNQDGPPGLNRGGPPGLNRGKPYGWKNTDISDQDERYPIDLDREDGYEIIKKVRPVITESKYGESGHSCRSKEFQCGNGKCIPTDSVCNYIIDCPDSSDEEYCASLPSTPSGCLLPWPPEGGDYQFIQCNTPCAKKAGNGVPLGSILLYSCHDFHVLRGNSTSICTNNTWTGRPICEKMCPPLESTTVDILCTYEEKTVSCSDQVKPGTRAKLSCKQSHFLPANSDPAHRDLVCLENANWNRQVFACIPSCGQVLHLSKYGNIYFPWYVGVYDRHNHDHFKHICGGTLISNNLVLSAAHCFYNEVYHTIEHSSRYYIAAGKYRRDWEVEENNAQKKSVEKIILPERYMGMGGNYAQDIAILKLVEPLEINSFVAPVCVDWDNVYEQKQLQEGRVGKVTGWGMQVDGTYSETRQEINVPYVSYNECLITVPYEFRRYITSDKFCAGDLNGSNLCSGHSGGGLFFETNGLWYIRGVVSVNPQKIDNCNYNSYVGFTYISIFREWIRSIYLSGQ